MGAAFRGGECAVVGGVVWGVCGVGVRRVGGGAVSARLVGWSGSVVVSGGVSGVCEGMGWGEHGEAGSKIDKHRRARPYANAVRAAPCVCLAQGAAIALEGLTNRFCKYR